MVPPTRLIPHSYSVGAKTTSPPAAKPPPPPSSTPSCPIHRRPPPSRRSRYPDVVVQHNRNRNALKDLAAEAEVELPPRRRRRRVPYQNHFDHAVLRLTVAARTSPPSTAPELFLLCRPSPPRICFPSADIRPRQHSQQFGHGFVQACALQNIGFPGKKKKIGATCGGDHTGNRKRYSSSLIRANLTSLLARYSSHRRH